MGGNWNCTRIIDRRDWIIDDIANWLCASSVKLIILYRLETVQLLVSTYPELIVPLRNSSSSVIFPHTPLHLASRNGHRWVFVNTYIFFFFFLWIHPCVWFFFFGKLLFQVMKNQLSSRFECIYSKLYVDMNNIYVYMYKRNEKIIL